MQVDNHTSEGIGWMLDAALVLIVIPDQPFGYLKEHYR